MNTTDFLTITAAICPDKEAVVFEGKRQTFSQLNERVNRLGNALLKLGVKKGDRIAMMQVNTSQCIEAYFAVAKIGGIYVPLNFRAKANELPYMLNTAEANTIFVGDRYTDLINGIKPELKTIKHYIALDKPAAGYLYYEDLMKTASPDDIYTDIDENETTILMYTAGTTGFPKGVMLTHNSFSMYVLENVSPPDPEMTEKNILTVPLYHVAGTQAVMSAIYGGRTLVIERQFDPEEWMTLVEKEKVGRAMMVPTMLKQLLDNPNFTKHNLQSLKTITYGAAPMPFEVIKRAIEAFPNTSFINAFGQTETASTVTQLTAEDHNITGTPEEKEKKLKRLSSIGKPLPDVQVKIVDEEGKEVPRGEVGEILIKGPRVMAGYWKDKEKTDKTLDSEGFIHTNDMAYQDEAGYIFLAGRATDMIKRAGEWISPEELEIVLNAHPKIEESAIIGIPDPEWGEVPLCVAVLKKGQKASADELMEYCRVNLASFKRPRAVVFCEELPRNTMGKILKKQLRETYGKK